MNSERKSWQKFTEQMKPEVGQAAIYKPFVFWTGAGWYHTLTKKVSTAKELDEIGVSVPDLLSTEIFSYFRQKETDK
jgi:hypothetical protein